MSFKLIDIEFFIENQKILNKKNLNLSEGEHVLIYGPSGSGKTTLINLMAGLLKPTSGKIYYRKTDYSSLKELQIDNLRKEKFGFIFQKLHLIEHLNVEQNISLGQNILCLEKLIFSIPCSKADNLSKLNGYFKLYTPNFLKILIILFIGKNLRNWYLFL